MAAKIVERSLNDGRQLIIRKALENDAKAIVNIVNQVASEEVYLLWDNIAYNVENERKYIARVNEMGDAIVLVVETNGQVIGVGHMERGKFKKNKHAAELGMTLIKGFRRLGAGSALIKEMLRWANEKGLEKVCLSVFSTNVAAIKFYQKFGFEVESARKKQFKTDQGYIDEILMAKFLV